MKNSIILLSLMSLLLVSCEYYPKADFSVDQYKVEPNERVYFRNLSSDASFYEWDFGDGYYSTERNPTHSYRNEGIYTVELAAISRDDHVDYAYIDIEVYYTELEVQVVDIQTNRVVSDVEVAIFDNFEDYVQNRNWLAYDFTDHTGSIIFYGNLEERRYYIDAQNQAYTNEFLGADDVTYIETPPLRKTERTVFRAYVEYLPIKSGKSYQKKRAARLVKVESSTEPKSKVMTKHDSE